jgi:hypothetical protein
MWNPVDTVKWNDSEWAKALADVQSSPKTLSCMRFIFQISSQAPEFYVGGNDSPFLLQFLSAPSEKGGDVDLIVTVISPLEDGVHYCFTGRGEDALSVCASFMEAFPTAPALIQKSDGSFDYVLCSLSDEQEKKTPVTLESLLRHQATATEADSLAFYLPAETTSRASPVSFQRFTPRPDIILD